MRLVVLDGITLNPGDLSWSKLKEVGDLKVYDRTPEDKIVERVRGAEIVFTNKVPLSETVLKKILGLKYIGVLATGFDNINTVYAKKRGILVTNVPEYGATSVVQMTFALLLELCFHVQSHSDQVKAGKWSRSKDFCFWDFPLTELFGKNMGIIGFGNIGQKVADVATAFGMNILTYSRTQTNQSNRKSFRWCELEELLKESDVVSIHCPLTQETMGLINESALKLMKKSAYLINTSRGAIIDENDLAKALETDMIAGAGLDVLSREPPLPDHPLFKTKNCLITPHISWATKEARQRLMDQTVENLVAYLSGKPINKVN